MCGNMVDIQFPTADNMGGKEKKKEQERRNYRTKI